MRLQVAIPKVYVLSNDVVIPVVNEKALLYLNSQSPLHYSGNFNGEKSKSLAFSNIHNYYYYVFSSVLILWLRRNIM